MQLTRTYKIAFAVLAALAAVGVGAYAYQFVGGLGVTGMSNGTSWGLYIACFMFFVGLSAGGLIVASSASIFHVAEYKKVALPAILVSLVCICIAGSFVLIDLGGIVRLLNLLVTPNFVSPLLWDICVISTYLVINLVYLYFMTSRKPGAKDKVAIVSRFALPVAILVHSVTAWIFGLQIAREGWYSTIMAPLFVASAMDSGLALLLLSLLWMNRQRVFATSRKLIANLAGLLAVCIAVDGYMVGCEVLTMGLSRHRARHGGVRPDGVGRNRSLLLDRGYRGRGRSVLHPRVRAQSPTPRFGRVGGDRRCGRRVLQAHLAFVHQLHIPERVGRSGPGERGPARQGVCTAWTVGQ
ncbi:NrfD/PsrC family molybdoenzyme membrane anchor subunit [Paraeggerthella sp.]|uniref:NrfD/PsrC family molybdoenzyme membrane anchor subunit n=1 Tax=Paraeggerthella sp. TaxID=2897350 RepID=UPI003529086F